MLPVEGIEDMGDKSFLKLKFLKRELFLKFNNAPADWQEKHVAIFYKHPILALVT